MLLFLLVTQALQIIQSIFALVFASRGVTQDPSNDLDLQEGAQWIGLLKVAGFRALNWILLFVSVVTFYIYADLLKYHYGLIRVNKTTWQEIKEREQRADTKSKILK